MSSGRSLGVLAASAAVSVALGAPASAGRGEVVAIVSKDIPPYKRALSGVIRVLPGKPVETLDEDGGQAIERVKQRHPTAVVAIGVKAARAARVAMPEVPLVYCLVLDPQENGLAGPRTFGVALEPALRDEIEVLHKALPALTRIGLAVNPSHPPPDLDDARKWAQASGLSLVVDNARDASELYNSVSRLTRNVDAIVVLAEPSIVTRDSFKAVVDLAMRHRLPVVSATDEFAKLGALISLSLDYEEAGRIAATLAEQIDQGKRPSDLPASKPEWQVTINLTTADAIGARVVPAVLEQARKIR